VQQGRDSNPRHDPGML